MGPLPPGCTCRRLEPDSHAPVDRPVRREARAGEDDVRGDADAEEVRPLLESEAETSPEAAVRACRLGVDLGGSPLEAAVDPRVSGEEELGEKVLAAFAEQTSHREPELQAGKAGAGADLELVVRIDQPAHASAGVAVGREFVAGLR